MEILAILIAAGIGYAITVGLKGHMAPSASAGGSPSGASATMAKTCIDTLDELPTGSSDIDNLRNAAKKAFLAASSPSEAMFLKSFANDLDSSGYHDAADCMRKRAAEIEGPATMITSSPMAAAPMPPPKPLFPVDTSTASLGSG